MWSIKFCRSAPTRGRHKGGDYRRKRQSWLQCSIAGDQVAERRGSPVGIPRRALAWAAQSAESFGTSIATNDVTSLRRISSMTESPLFNCLTVLLNSPAEVTDLRPTMRTMSPG